jgi:hypothetical protein
MECTSVLRTCFVPLEPAQPKMATQRLHCTVKSLLVRIVRVLLHEMRVMFPARDCTGLRGTYWYHGQQLASVQTINICANIKGHILVPWTTISIWTTINICANICRLARMSMIELNSGYMRIMKSPLGQHNCAANGRCIPLSQQSWVPHGLLSQYPLIERMNCPLSMVGSAYDKQTCGMCGFLGCVVQ